MHRRYPQIDTDAAQAAWLDAIEEAYGVRLGAGQVYVDARSGRVYAGSEYVAQVGPDADPARARLWADSLAHMPRFGSGIEVAERQAERPSGYTHPLDRRREWCASERDDAVADLNAHLERKAGRA